MKRCVLIAAMCLLINSELFAADADGRFAAKGAGRKTCSEFITAHDSKSREYYLYGGWLEGYISAYNGFQDDSYDITPWQTTELMLLLLKHHCGKNPESRFLTAVNSFFKLIFADRLVKENPLVKISVNNTESYYYSEILIRAKTRLQKMGFLQGEVDDDFDDQDVAAFAAYQKTFGLKETGIPDQYTLANLFFKQESK